MSYVGWDGGRLFNCSNSQLSCASDVCMVTPMLKIKNPSLLFFIQSVKFFPLYADPPPQIEEYETYQNVPGMQSNKDPKPVRAIAMLQVTIICID